METAWLTTDQMIEVDRIMMEDLRIELIQMMENAGRNLAQLARERFNPKSVAVCAGAGGNGGGGLVAARHLHNAGVDVTFVLANEDERFTGVPAHQLDVVNRMGVTRSDTVPESDLILDAVIGYSLKGAPRGLPKEIIDQIVASDAAVLSLDVPSGIDTASGVAHAPHVVADATMTLALPKVGLRGQDSVGELYLADISVPPSVYDSMGVGPAPDFTESSVVRVS